MQLSVDELMERAKQALLNAHAPYSHFRVGAAVLAADGRVFTGANVENASYGLTICAERVAIVSAITAGAPDIVALAVTTETPPSAASEAMPCGACRQVMAEFMRPDAVVHIDSVGERPLAELLPDAFRLARRWCRRTRSRLSACSLGSLD